jgi:hypothetical protein
VSCSHTSTEPDIDGENGFGSVDSELTEGYEMQKNR